MLLLLCQKVAGSGPSPREKGCVWPFFRPTQPLSLLLLPTSIYFHLSLHLLVTLGTRDSTNLVFQLDIKGGMGFPPLYMHLQLQYGVAGGKNILGIRCLRSSSKLASRVPSTQLPHGNLLSIF